MESNTVVWIVVAVLVVIAIAAVAFAARRRSHARRHMKAERIREEVTEHTAKVDKRAALADETAAKGRAAEADAQAKAAEAARLKAQASSHHDAVAESRAELEERRRRADHLDPKTRAADDQGKEDIRRPDPESRPAPGQFDRQ
jgi:hypothetical protein